MMTWSRLRCVLAVSMLVALATGSPRGVAAQGESSESNSVPPASDEDEGGAGADESSGETTGPEQDAGDVEPAGDHPENHPPRVLHEPELAPLAGLSEGGEVLLSIIVETDGALSGVAVLEATPAEHASALEAAAIAHVNRVRFEAAVLNGRPLRVRVRYRVTFPPPSGSPAGEEQAPDGPAAEDPAAEGATEGPAAERASPAPPDSDEPAVDGADEDFDEDEDGGGWGAEATVESTLEEIERAAVSDMEIEIGELRRVPRDNAQNMLTIAPGILVTQVQNEGHSAAMFLRGFDAEEGEDLEILLQGIPLNEPSNAHGHGYADTLVIIPELVESVRVVQGPFDPVQGDFAVAGSAEYRLGLQERGLHGQVGYGTYGQHRVALWWGPEGQETGTVAGFAYNAGDGWGTNRAFSNFSAMGQYEGRGRDRRLRYRLLFFGGAGSWDQAGLLREDDYESGALPCDGDDFEQFYCTYDARQGGSTTRAGGSADITWLDGPDRFQVLAFGMGRMLRVQENFTGFSGDPRTDGGIQRGDLVDQRYDAATLGMRASYRRRFSVLDRVQQIELGVFVRQDFTDTVLDRVRSPVVGPAVPYAVDFDRALTITNLAGYLRADIDVQDWLNLMAGVRVDAFAFQVVDRNFATEDVFGERLRRDASDAFGFIVQPRGSVDVRFLEGLHWVTSLGRGARSSDAVALSEGELAPFAEVTAAETGLSLELGDEARERAGEGYYFSAALAGFFTRVSQDLVFDAANGRNTVTGPSHRTGATLSGRLRWGGWFDGQLAATYTRAHLPPSEASAFEFFAGPRLPYIPEWLVRFDGAASHDFHVGGETIRGSLALGALFLSPRPLPFEEFSDPWFVLDAAASGRWRWFELGISAQNLLDLRYRNAEFNYVSNFGDPAAPPSMMTSRHFAAAPPLRVMGTLTFHVQFASPAPWASADGDEPRVTGESADAAAGEENP